MKVQVTSPVPYLARVPRRAAPAAMLLGALLLGGCYVVPLQPRYPAAAPATGMAAVPPSPLTFTARLYPANDQATGYGVVNAVVSNELDGRGTFSVNIGGETYNGEATRVANSARDGIANGAGNRGGYINCRYTLNNATQGTGNCVLNNGAQFSMHIGR